MIRWEDLYRDYAPHRLPWNRQKLFASTCEHLSRLPLDRMERALDVGCGSGELTSALQNLTKLQFIGIDLSPHAIELAAGRFCRPGRPLEFAVGDALSLPFPDGTFDLVFDRGCLHSLAGDDERRSYLDEVHRVTNAGGVFLLTAMGSDPAHPWRSRAARTLLQGVRLVGPREVEMLVADRFFSEDRLVETAWTPLSFRYLPIGVPVVFQCHCLRKVEPIAPKDGEE